MSASKSRPTAGTAGSHTCGAPIGVPETGRGYRTWLIARSLDICMRLPEINLRELEKIKKENLKQRLEFQEWYFKWSAAQRGPDKSQVRRFDKEIHS